MNSMKKKNFTSLKKKKSTFNLMKDIAPNVGLGVWAQRYA